MSETSRARRSQAGFTLMELMVTMGIAAALMGMGAGLFTAMGRRTASDNALASVSSLIVNVRNASSRFPAALAVDPKEGTVRGVGQEVRQELHWDPRQFAGVQAAVYENGIEGRECNWAGCTPEPTGGRVGGALRLNGGRVDCRSQAAYDVTEGVTIELWMKPENVGPTELVSKGDALRVRLESGSRISATIGVRDEKATEKITLTATVPGIRPNQWLGVQVGYDRQYLTISTNTGFGWIERGRKTEERPLAPSPDASLTVGGYAGLLDDFRFAGVHSTPPLVLPQGVQLVGDKSYRIRFLNGHLDPSHLSAQRVAMESAGRRTTLEIALNGMMTVAYTNATVDAPAAGTDRPKGPAKKE